MKGGVEFDTEKIKIKTFLRIVDYVREPLPLLNQEMP
jgi:hypothetical protein